MTQPQRSDSPKGWDEAQSRLFIDYGRYFVPERERQVSTISALLPRSEEPFLVLDVACGEGLLSEAILEAHTSARVYGLDGSEEMLTAARKRMSRFGERFQTFPFDLFERRWPQSELPILGVVSSLAVHHLEGTGKAAFFQEAFDRLAPGGMLIIADLVQTAGENGRELAAAAWDEFVRARSLELDGNTAGFDHFQRERWNMYRYFDPEDIDRPSRLLDQLLWLKQAGFDEIDVYWMLAGHAIFGGRKISRS